MKTIISGLAALCVLFAPRPDQKGDSNISSQKEFKVWTRR